MKKREDGESQIKESVYRNIQARTVAASRVSTSRHREATMSVAWRAWLTLPNTQYRQNPEIQGNVFVASKLSQIGRCQCEKTAKCLINTCISKLAPSSARQLD